MRSSARGEGRKSRLHGGWEGEMVTFMRIGEAVVVWREVLQRQAVIKEVQFFICRDRIMLEYNGKIG